MRVALLASLLGAAAANAAAQEARIQSGEHETFSRLVIYLPEAAEYEVETGEQRFFIDFGAEFAIDTSNALYYLPRGRLTGLTSDPGRLGLELDCDCVVTVERLSPTIVYLDINDPGTVPEPPSEVAATAEVAAPAMPLIRLPALTEAYPATLLPGGLPVMGETRAAEVDSPVELGPEVTGTSYAVAEQIARAAAQGLVDVQGPLPPLPSQRADPVRTKPAVEPEAESTTPASDGARRHMSIRTSIDEAMGRDVAEALSELGTVGSCLPAEIFDASAWLPDGPAGFATLRSAAIGEFDRAAVDGVVDLARGYIALTFGAEARQVIESFKVDVPDADILLAMADIVDDGRAARPGRLLSQYDCSGPSALWAALSQTEIPDAAELDADAVALAFGQLPAEMRRRLGPDLAERLIAHGAVDAASVVRSALRRAPGAPTIEAELLDATIALETGQARQADAKLAAVVEETSGRNAEAVQRLIARRIAAGESIEPDVLAAADALIYEHRGTPEADRLAELRIEALAKNGEARRALAFLEDASRQLPEATVARLRGISYTEAARQLDDAEFLLVAVRAADELGRTPEEMAARRDVASRLGEMELYRLAEALGVGEGRPAMAAPAVEAPTARPSLREPMPEIETPLERTAELVRHSAALRDRLAAALGSETATE